MASFINIRLLKRINSLSPKEFLFFFIYICRVNQVYMKKNKKKFFIYKLQKQIFHPPPKKKQRLTLRDRKIQ